VILIIVEVVIIAQVMVAVCLSRAQDAVFDAVHVRLGGEWTINRPENAIQMQHSTWVAIRFALWRGFVMIVALPLNLIPYAGTVLYACVCGYFLAWSLHHTWMQEFQQRKTMQQQRAFVGERLGQYVAFGCICQMLELVPLVNILAFFSNVAGAAMWAAEMDNAVEHARMDAPLLEEQAESVEM